MRIYIAIEMVCTPNFEGEIIITPMVIASSFDKDWIELFIEREQTNTFHGVGTIKRAISCAYIDVPVPLKEEALKFL